MKASDRILIWLLRVSGGVMLTAMFAVFMPQTWMNEIHRLLGLGELPDVPIVGYLARSASALYALHGALLIVVSLDVRRYLGIIRFLGGANLVMGVLFFGMDWAVGMPWSWTLCEGPPVFAFGVVLLVLASRVRGRGEDSVSALLSPGGPVGQDSRCSVFRATKPGARSPSIPGGRGSNPSETHDL